MDRDKAKKREISGEIEKFVKNREEIIFAYIFAYIFGSFTEDEVYNDIDLAKIGEEDENILKIILFGSLAEKRAVPGSDADILIIFEREDKTFMDRIAVWSEKFSLDFPVEIFPYTEKELNNPIALEAIKKGITLFER